jgi:hypothetical protein
MDESQNTPETPATKPSPRLVEVEVTNEIVALNLLVSFLTLAQKRGSFTIDESAKIWECIKKFQK